MVGIRVDELFLCTVVSAVISAVVSAAGTVLRKVIRAVMGFPSLCLLAELTKRFRLADRTTLI